MKAKNCYSNAKISLKITNTAIENEQTAYVYKNNSE
jgi:hypothetical protein